jgi:hypothetical protein
METRSNRKAGARGLAVGALCLIAILIGAGRLGRGAGRTTDAKMTEPRYVEEKQLVLPEGYQNWVFVGASLGLSYSEPARETGPGLFHHVYLQPEAFAHYQRTGQFPEKTMLVMELHRPEQKVSINKGGYFQGDRVGIEVAVKDREKFEEGWAYFDFANGRRKQARAFPKNSCFSCHQQHGADDNVFTQFYPVLRAARKTN